MCGEETRASPGLLLLLAGLLKEEAGFQPSTRDVPRGERRSLVLQFSGLDDAALGHFGIGRFYKQRGLMVNPPVKRSFPKTFYLCVDRLIPKTL